MTENSNIPHRIWKVFVDDSFHYMDEDERYLLGEYDSRDEALAACKKNVDDFLSSQIKPGMTAEQLFQHYSSFGEDPFIIDDDPNNKFSAWDYARERCGTICGPPPDHKIPPLKTRPIPGRVPFAPSSKVVSEMRRRKRQSGDKNYTGNRSFFNWELRPAVSEGARAWSVLAPGEDWTEVDLTEVVDSGKPLDDEDALREAFSRTFSDLPDLPIATVIQQLSNQEQETTEEISAPVPKDLSRLSTRQDAGKDVRTLIASEIISMKTMRATHKAPLLQQLAAGLVAFRLEWKTNVFWLAYIIIMHTFLDSVSGY